MRKTTPSRTSKGIPLKRVSGRITGTDTELEPGDGHILGRVTEMEKRSLSPWEHVEYLRSACTWKVEMKGQDIWGTEIGMSYNV